MVDHPQSGPNHNKAQRRPLRTIRSRLLIQVNGALAVALVILLVVDYRRSLRARLEQKQSALAEEARALLAVMSHLKEADRLYVQKHLDRVCASMKEEESPGHHVAMRLHEILYQAHSHHRASPEILAAMQRASPSNDHLSRFGEQTLIVGIAQDEKNAVYVSENLHNVRRAIIRQVFWHLAAMFLLCVVGAVIVNLALVRLVARPVEQLAATVQLISSGKLGAQTAAAATREMDILSSAINEMSLTLAQNDHERRMQLTKARQVQEHLLPDLIKNEDLETAHLYLPASTVAGDYYDVLQLPDGSWLFCIADVTGHGIAAAMGAVVLKTLILEATKGSHSPACILAYLNERFCAVSLPADFATMLVARWEPRASQLIYASAGHEKGYLISTGGATRELQSTGLPLGIEPDDSWESLCLDVSERDRLFLVTDGLAEAQNREGEQFGRRDLVSAFAAFCDLPLECVPGEIEHRLALHRQGRSGDDDVTVLIIDLKGELKHGAHGQ